MNATPLATLLTQEDLLSVIRVQTDIARLGLDLSAVMDSAVGEARRLTDADGAAAELVEGEFMVYRAGAGLALEQIGLSVPIAHSLSGLCTQSAEALRCDDALTDPRVDADTCRRVGLRSMIVVPLRFEHEVVGVLKVMSLRAAAFGERDVLLLGLMADLVAAAMYFATRSQSDVLFHRATHDVLTGLANRALFLDRLRNAIRLADRIDQRAAVLVIDMDHFKRINDTYGHSVGDMALREFAARLEHETRKSDTVARLGGDEFGVVLAPSPEPSRVKCTIERISAAIEQPFSFDCQWLPLHASVGAAVYPDDASDIDTLLEKADKAMYAAKHARHAETGQSR